MDNRSLTHKEITSRMVQLMAEGMDKMLLNEMLEEAFYKVLGEGYRKFLTQNFKFTGYELIEQEIQGNTLIMYQGVWKGTEQMDGITRKLSVQKETIDKLLDEEVQDDKQRN